MARSLRRSHRHDSSLLRLTVLYSFLSIPRVQDARTENDEADDVEHSFVGLVQVVQQGELYSKHLNSPSQPQAILRFTDDRRR